MGQGYEDHLVTQEAAIPEAYKTCFKFWNHVKGLYTNDIQRLYKIDKFFMVLTLIGLRPDLETSAIRFLAVPPFHPWMMHLLASSVSPPLRLCHLITLQILLCISLTGSEYDDYLCYQATKSTSIASVAQTDSGASDHISSNKDLFSFYYYYLCLPTVTLANGSQTVAKGIGLAHPLPSLPLTSVLYTPEPEYREDNCIGRESQGLYHLTSPSTPAVCISTYTSLLIHSRLGHPSLSKFRKMVPRFSSLLSLTQTFCQSHKMHLLGILQTSKVSVFSPTSVYHRRHRVTVPPSLAEYLLTHFLSLHSPPPALSPPSDLPISLGNPPLGLFPIQAGDSNVKVGSMVRLIALTSLVAKAILSYGSDYGDTFSLLPRYFCSSIALHGCYVFLPLYQKYALDILEETGMLDCKPVDTPMDPNVKLIPGQGEPLRDPGRYRRLVGKLNYLIITHPDISFPVSVVSQFLQSPCDSHWNVVIRILRYIKSTSGQGVLYENRGHTQVVGYTDADWLAHPQIDVPLLV
ncbi:Retrovirus-related Pol polyprotein from transposon RE2 [Vitis vinifera]|uniref:Retrovirus-related Pol polyprotein from transposon RE2 n=1 Tax=Vitis vinifera TaxID=29760 RepID=A0A438HU97_VITVI|nr:Retrovirus-related Pol polyprotein from transposon RE2 [Vitis vinifera]